MAATILSGTMMSTTFLRRQNPVTTSVRVNLGQAQFGLKSSNKNRGGRVTCMAAFKVKLITPEGEQEFECPDDVYVLDHAEEVGIDLPYSCRAGSCSSCCGKVVSGSVDQSDQSFLSDEQIKEGYVLTCVAYPQSDLVIQTHTEGEIF